MLGLDMGSWARAQALDLPMLKGTVLDATNTPTLYPHTSQTERRA